MRRWGTAHLVGSLVLALNIAHASSIPAPQDVFGFRIGEDYRLADYTMLLRYFRILAERSDRMFLLEYGRSVQGRPLILAIISSPENLNRLETYRSIARRLALAEVGSEEEAWALAQRGKAVVWIDSGLHATEIAHAQHAIELAYQLLSRNDPEVHRILDHVILLLAPCINPDGMDLVVHWYWKHQNLRIPELYHVYVGHDNNRDFIMLTQPESQAIARILFREWFPQIVYNHHQPAPYGTAIFVPPFRDPFNTLIDPLVLRGIELVAAAMKVRYEMEGKAGVVSREVFSAWWNGGLRTTAYFHNMIGILTETGIADPAPRRILPDQVRIQPRVDYPNPLGERIWRLRDSVEYMLTGSLAVLDVAARYRETFLYNMYLIARRSIERGRTEPPYAYIIPADQRDFLTAVRFVNVLIRGGIQVHRLREDRTVAGRTVPAGSFVIQTAQPFRAHLLDLMEPQRYPSLPGASGPYDIAGWTIRYQMGVDVLRLEDPLPDGWSAVLEPVTGEVLPPPGKVEGTTSFAYALDTRTNDAFRAVMRLLRAKVPVYRLSRFTSLGDQWWPAGTFLVQARGGFRERFNELARTLGVSFAAVPPPSEPIEVFQIRLPRVGLHDVYGGNIDEGWTRWVLEQFEFPYRKLWGAEIRAGQLDQKFDVIVLPHGIRTGTERTPMRAPRRLGFTGPLPKGYEERVPIGEVGVAALRQFVERGGTLVTMGSAAMVAIRDLGVPLRNVLMERTPEGGYRPIPRARFFCPGSVLEAEFDPAHPVAFGMPPVASVFFQNSPTFEILPEGMTRVRVIARYPNRNPLKSGWIRGEALLFRQIAVAEVSMGRGRIILLGPRVQFRGQPHGTFKLLFNAILYGVSEPTLLR